jgi:hypothetical protein
MLVKTGSLAIVFASCLPQRPGRQSGSFARNL